METARANAAAMRRDIEAIRQLLGLPPLTSRPRLAVVLEDEDDA
jgi:hypothetical protein